MAIDRKANIEYGRGPWQMTPVGPHYTKPPTLTCQGVVGECLTAIQCLKATRNNFEGNGIAMLIKYKRNKVPVVEWTTNEKNYVGSRSWELTLANTQQEK